MRPTPPNLVDVAALWDQLPPALQREIGLAAVVVAVAAVGLASGANEAGHEAALDAGHDTLEALLAAHLPKPLLLPDLAAIGVKACDVYGCTDRTGRAAGYQWIVERRCSECGRGP